MADEDDTGGDKAGAGHMRRSEVAGTVAGPSVLPGAEVQRNTNGTTFFFKIDALLARVTADVQFGGSIVQNLDMTYQKPVVNFDLADPAMGAARGALMARFAGPPKLSAVQGDFVVVPPDSDPEHAEAFRGDIVVWDSPENLILDRFSTFVAPTLEVRVELGDSTVDQMSRDPITARVRVIYVNQVVAEETIFATKPMVTMPAVKVGTIEIDKDAQLLYRPATMQQSGEVTLNMTGRDIYGSEFDFAGALAQWEYPVVRPRDAEHLPHGFEAEPPRMIEHARDAGAEFAHQQDKAEDDG